ncbi:MAG TPA: hypothetical protein VEU31_01360 [Candidatus Acidoferrales bacterium]|nr:hypothetical protein [Candidatus Acidoferrales bacterium]
MKRAKRRTIRRNAQSGYALLMVIFMAALMIIAAAAIQTNILTQGRREKEAELIWRGQQYARGVRLFFRKNNRFPTSMDDLIKPGVGVRYMRKAYKDPMNGVDGSWRLLYVGPAGQIIGSVKANPGGSLFGSGMMPGAAQTSGSAAGQGAPPSASGGGTAPAQGNPAGSATPTDATSPQGSGSQSSGLGSDSPIMGGNIIGVASKVNRASIKVYDSGRNYREWEFIYNPSKDVTMIGQQGVAPGTQNKQCSGTIPGPQNPPPNPPPNLPPQNPQQ